MAVSPGSKLNRSTLYRTSRRAVILSGLALILASLVVAQTARRSTASKAPRALGLVELGANGKARLIPITILYDGKFYDASAYKATPVPMALESGTVYEAFLTGVSQGLFTVAGALQSNKQWIGQGNWQSASAIAAAATAAAKKQAAQGKPPSEPVDAPPTLRRSVAEKPKEPEPAPAPAAAPPIKPAPAPAAAPAPVPPPATEEDHSGPVLRRGKPSTLPEPASSPVPAKPPATKPAAPKPQPAVPSPAANSVQLIPAISATGGAEPRPYAYVMKADEEEQFNKKMLVLAAAEVRTRAALLASETTVPSRAGKPAPVAKASQPTFENIQLRVFDLSSSNEPILVMTATARMPRRTSTSSAADETEYMLTLVARQDIYGDLHKAFSNTTDSRHLDSGSRMELIDAVDVDGDGRAELLFRQTSDAGTAFVLYRVIGDQLWALFQGTPEK